MPTCWNNSVIANNSVAWGRTTPSGYEPDVQTTYTITQIEYIRLELLPITPNDVCYHYTIYSKLYPSKLSAQSFNHALVNLGY